MGVAAGQHRYDQANKHSRCNRVALNFTPDRHFGVDNDRNEDQKRSNQTRLR